MYDQKFKLKRKNWRPISGEVTYFFQLSKKVTVKKLKKRQIKLPFFGWNHPFPGKITFFWGKILPFEIKLFQKEWFYPKTAILPAPFLKYDDFYVSYDNFFYYCKFKLFSPLILINK